VKTSGAEPGNYGAIKMTKKLFFCCLAAAAVMLCGCKATKTRMVGAEEAKNAYADAQVSLRAGTTTLDDMIAKYGNYQDRAATSSGFACRWQERRTVIRRANRYGQSINMNPRAAGEHVYTVNYVSTLEAFFTSEGVLIDFRIMSDLP
jgi:hypothetical protein